MFSGFAMSSVAEFGSNRNRMSLLSSGSASTTRVPPVRIGAIATFCSLKSPLFSSGLRCGQVHEPARRPADP